MKKFFYVILFLSGLFLAGHVNAAATISNVRLDGVDNLAVESGHSITATVWADITDETVWRATAYKLGDEAWFCVDTFDHKAGLSEEKFIIAAPIKQGTINVEFEIFENDNCTNGLDVAKASAGLLGAASKIIMVPDNWVPWSLLLLVMFAVLLSVFYIINKWRTLQ